MFMIKMIRYNCL